MAYTPFKGIETPGPRRDLVGYGRNPPKVVWPNGARIAINLALNFEEGSEYNHPNGDARNDGLVEMSSSVDPRYRDLCVESVFEYGTRAGIWRLERLLTELKLPVTFFAAAVSLERNLEVAAWLREAGHEPCSHGWRWEEVWKLSREDEADHIRRAIKSSVHTCGKRPSGWYCRYGASIHTRELLVEEGGFAYDSDAYNDDLPYYVDVMGRQHLVIPYTMTYNDAKFGFPQGYGSPTDFVDNLKRGFDALWDEGETHPRMMSIGLHPRLIGQASRIHALREFFEHAEKKGKVWFARRLDIADWWQAHSADFGT